MSRRHALRDCCKYPVALLHSSLAIRTLDEALYLRQLEPEIAVESGSLEFLRGFIVRKDAVTFLPLSGVPRVDDRICARPVSVQGLDALRVAPGQLRDRSPSIAAGTVADQPSSRLPGLP
ncbi:hypothetical protein [Burkholderia anthina]|uniref:hypothetical protein n=1 Tax=Burkholderia anthina TaxID=179879 RepID=UPI001AA016DB|nr:hypothetical protein [Burkholderia anthina]QTD94975.1 hypothetical protein J4G50_33675 [Burkholderia anthina]